MRFLNRHRSLLAATGIFAAASLLTLSACGSSDTSDTTTTSGSETTATTTDPGSGKTVEVTDTDDGSTVDVAVGDTLEILLESNATTGYTWIVDKIDSDLVEQDGQDEYIAPESDAMGAPGHQLFKFKVLKAGSSEIELAYVRPAEEGQPAAQTFTITVSAKS